jgi:RHS repeat-associated protein
VLLFHHFNGLNEYEGLVHSVDFEYDTSTEQDFTFLKSITTVGYIKKADGSYSIKKLPSMEFGYQKHEWNSQIQSISADSVVHAPVGIDDRQYHFTDLFGEGLSGILSEQANGWFYKRNQGGGKFEQAKLVSPKPTFAGYGKELQLADLDADGGKQLVSYGTEPKGYFELNDDNVWEGFKSFKGIPNVDFGDPNTRMLDLNGDGLAEVVITEDRVFSWHKSEGRNGFAAAQKTAKSYDEEEGPHILFADSTQSIFLADMSGDGMTDIVRIKNGDVCYWPNLGYGKFGAKVAFDNAPFFDHPEAYNPTNLRLADIDGSGTADIIYLGKNKFACWNNLSGNSFGKTPFEIDGFPEIHAFSNISVVDLLGNGVACIVCSSQLSKDANSPVKYIDLMNSKKPHILVSYKNNMGKEVSLEYTPSTKFYIDDKLAGKPWVTKLHFPVHCVSKTITEDKVSGYKFVSEYKYHHGYYDHPEREFRGFGMVEQIDSETFEHWKKGSATNIVEEQLHQEPVVTKTWNHTGAFLQKDKILNQFAKDYWFEEMQRSGFAVAHHEMELPDARLEIAPGLNPSILENLSSVEWREALRACKGMGLRTEIFAKDAVKSGNTEDAIKKELTPFTVATHNCIVELLQPKGKNKHAVFVVKESEAITYNYERNTDDPRIAHSLNIKLDEYGNVLESASVVYPRITAQINAEPLLPLETKQEQGKTIIIYKQKNYTNDVINNESYRLRLQCEEKTYELRNVAKSGSFYTPANFTDILLDINSDTAGYHEIGKAFGAKPMKRLIEHTRNIFYGNNLNNVLPLYTIDSLALNFEGYQLAFTPDLLSDIFGPANIPGSKITDALMDEGKYTHSEGDANWWIRSGKMQFIDGAETKNDAQNRFYVPISYNDPFGSKTRVKYYGNYFLFIEETEDALGNKSKVDVFNFRTLSPQRMKDMNNNLSEAITDELGFVKATAVMGKDGNNDGIGEEADDLLGLTQFTAQTEIDLINDFFNVPETINGVTDSVVLAQKANLLLQHSTTRYVYDFDVYKNIGKPIVVATIVREEHFRKNNNSPVQLSFEYSNGMGKVVMKKVQANPGSAKKVVVNPDNTFTIISVDSSALLPKQLRWIGNGRTVVNNKGKAVKLYEPYFSVSNKFEDVKELVETGVTPLMFYDAMGRLIKTQMPNEAFSKVEFTSWKQLTFDANDNILNSAWYSNRTGRLIDAELIAAGKNPEREKIAADKAAKHADTPNVLYFDTLGRPILSIGHNKNMTSNADEFYRTKTMIDIEGNLRRVTDAREIAENGNQGNLAMQYKYDMLGNMVYQTSMDAGQRWLLNNVTGNPLRTWDERKNEFQYFYDVLHRPLQSKVIGGDGLSPLDNIFDRYFYGEAEVNPELNNLRGKVTKHFDTGGVVLTPEYDFKGQPKFTTRQLYKDYKTVANWSDVKIATDLEITPFKHSTETDALGRTIMQTLPDGSITTFSYNETGLLNGESVALINPVLAATYIKEIDYNEKGLRNKIVYGNDVTTRFFYDKETFRLNRLESKRKNNEVLQDLFYTYDPVGNNTAVEDKSIPISFFANDIIEPVSEFTYDALYRLANATGRENNVAFQFTGNDNWNDSPFMQNINSGDPMNVRSFIQTYLYDEVGNIKQMKNLAIGNNWTRNYEYEKLNNRLKNTKIGAETYTYTYHPIHGFISEMPHLEELGWNFKEELVKSIRQKVSPANGSAETTYYQYDGKGQRIRKITENFAAAGVTPTKKEERIYVSNYETYRTYQSNIISFERETLRLIDEGNCFAIIETRNNVNDGTEKRLVRYQLNNNLGSSVLEIDGSTDAKVITYEEFHPFGTTAYQAKNSEIKSAAKRYRFTGMERDEETGLEYHSARYYIPWLGRWLSTDKERKKEVTNRYQYVTNNPVTYFDSNGLFEEPVHGALTYKLALAAGFTERDAAEIALATAGMDHDPATSPGLNERTERLHFPSFEEASAGVETEISKGTRMNLKTFGQRLHSLEDVGFRDAPGPHRRGDGPALGYTIAGAGVGIGMVSAFLIGVGSELYGNTSSTAGKVGLGIMIGIGILAGLFALASIIAAVVIGNKIGHPQYTTERGAQSDSFSHVADEGYQDPRANTAEMRRIFQVLKRAAIAKYGTGVVSDDALANAAIAEVVNADTEGKINTFLNRPGVEASGAIVRSYSDQVARQAECGTAQFGNIVTWTRSHIDATVDNSDITYRPSRPIAEVCR